MKLNTMTRFAALLIAAMLCISVAHSQESMQPSEKNFVGASGVTYNASTGVQNVQVQDIPAAQAAGWIYQNAHIQNSGTFSISSGCGTVTNVSGSLVGGSFHAGQTTCTPVISLPAAPHGYYCAAWDITTNTDTLKMTAETTTSCTLSGTVASADQIVFVAIAF